MGTLIILAKLHAQTGLKQAPAHFCDPELKASMLDGCPRCFRGHAEGANVQVGQLQLKLPHKRQVELL